jgi:MoaA/NifB/PqqE/SkfB family radical SAM enzyme
VHLTVTPQNASTARELIGRLRQAGVEALSLSLADPALQQQVSLLRDYAAEINLRLVSDLPVPYSTANPVTLETAQDDEPEGAGKVWLYVEPDGDVLPAQGMADQIRGNFLKDSWEKIYRV